VRQQPGSELSLTATKLIVSKGNLLAHSFHIDWAMAYRKNKELRAAYNETASEELPNNEAMPPSLIAAFIREEGLMVDEGIGYLKKAIKLRPDYDDAMAYLNLLYRQKADMEWNREDRDRDLRLADDLVDQVKKIKEKKMKTRPPER